MTDIVIHLGTPAAPVKLVLRGQEASGFLEVKTILLAAQASLLAQATLPAPVPVPVALLAAEGNDRRFLTAAEIDQRVRDLLAQNKRQLAALLEAQREDVARRFRSIHVDWGNRGTFLGRQLTGSFNGSVSLALEQLLLTFPQPTGVNAEARALVELRAEASVAAAQAHLQGALSVVLRFRAAAGASVSLDFDDINLALPEIELPDLDLGHIDLVMPSLATLPGRFAGMLGKFARDVAVSVSCTVQPRLVVVADNDGLRAAIVVPDVDHGELKGAADPALLAPLTVTVTRGATQVLEITALKAGIFSQGTHFSFQTNIGAGSALADGTRNFSPLSVSWSGASVGARITAISVPGGQGAAVSTVLHFERLTIGLIGDPATSVSFKGTIELTPSGVHVLDLAIIAPYPLKLISNLAGALQRGAHKLIDLFADVQINQGDLDGVRELLRIFGRLAAAVGRAAVSVSETLGSVLAKAGEALETVLVRAGEMIGKLLAEVARLLPENAPAGNLPHLQVELRIATEPLALRQILVSVRQPPAPSADTILTALGLQLTLSGSWHPALLVDLSGTPSAYLLARRGAASARKVATLSTDLWLENDGRIEAVRDADPAGNRPDNRLIALAVETDMTAIMLIGLEGGTARFLQKVTDSGGQPVAIGSNVHVLAGGLEFGELAANDVKIDVAIDKDRILPLLGMGEPGGEPDGPTEHADSSFLDRLKSSLAQVVTVTGHSAVLDGSTVKITLKLDIQAAGLKSAVDLGLDFDLGTFEAKLSGGPDIAISGDRIDETALGLRWIIEPFIEVDQQTNERRSFLFKLSFANGEQRLELYRDEHNNSARMQLRLDGLSSDGSGVVFDVSTFSIGRGGLTLEADVAKSVVKLAGLDAPFDFSTGRLRIAGSRLTEAMIEGTGRLPDQLVGEASCTVTLMLAETAEGIVVQSGRVKLEKIGQPIVCHATRFTLTLSDIGIGFVREDRHYHFYFLLTGSLRFTPKGSEFGDGLLKNLSDVEITLDQVPLTGDARVLARHISFQKAIKPPKTFNLFNLFKMQIKGIGYHPSSPKFEGDPAICISGQIDLVEIGDIMKPKIDFHGLWIAPPRHGESLPRIKADGLGVDLQLSGAVKVRGTVLAVDPDTRTVEGKEIAPPGYSAYGFLGEGELEIPGWGALEASLGFLEIENNETKERKKAFFFYLQKDKLAVEIPTPIWTFWLREAGFGFGYRYTLAGIKDAEAALSVAQLIKSLDEVSKTQGDLARFSAWKPDADKDNFTLALRGAFQPYPAAKTWNEQREKIATMPFFFDIVAALRSDMTLLMSARGWLGVNYSSFLANKDDFRSRPGFRGYLYISAPRKELLMRGIADSKGYIGEDWPEVRTGSVLRKAVESVDWSTLLYIRPGLLHYEMGWPDQLSVRLVDSENMKVTVRGGMIFRAAEDGLLFGYNVEADAWLRFRGSAGRSIGASIEAELKAHLTARVIAFLAWQFNGSLVYGLASLDAKLVFSVSAWMEVDLGFKSFTIRIGFRFSVQLSAAVELAITDKSVGGRVAARVGVQAFGCTLSISVGFAFNDGALAQARARVARFLAMSLTNEETALSPQAATQKGDRILDTSAQTAPKPAQLPTPTPSSPAPAPGPTPHKPDIDRTTHGRLIQQSDFWLVMRDQPGGMAVALLIPKESSDLGTRGSFYAAPGIQEHPELDQIPHVETDIRYKLSDIPAGIDAQIWVPGETGNYSATHNKFAPLTNDFEVKCRWNAPIPGAPDTPTASGFTLGYFFDECFLAHTRWFGEQDPVRKTLAYREAAAPRIHGKPRTLDLAGRDREIERDRVQRAQAHHAGENPDDERLYAARSTLMAMFLDQWSTIDIAALEARADTNAHVSDLGLLFYGEPRELEKLAAMRVRKKDVADTLELPGKVEILNARDNWFDRADPVLDADAPAITSEGIKLNWRLAPAFVDSTAASVSDNPEQLLQYYHIVRTIEGAAIEPASFRVKAAALLGKPNDPAVNDPANDPAESEALKDHVDLVAPDWQFVDGLEESTGVPAAIRQALLPGGGPETLLKSAMKWAETFAERDSVTVTYTVTPVDIAGVEALGKSFVVEVPRPAMPVRAAKAEIRVMQQAADSLDDFNLHLQSDVSVYLALRDDAWQKPDDVPDGYKIERSYRLFVESDAVEPEGSYGTDGMTARIRGPVFGVPRADALRIELSRACFSPGADKPDAGAILGIEPDDEERAKFPLWAKLGRGKFDEAGESVFKTSAEVAAFFDQLAYGRKGRRVATRFSLQTVVTVTPPKPAKPDIYPSKAVTPPKEPEPVVYTSEFVTLPIEHVVFRTNAAKDGVAMMRPDALEIAVPMAMPPLGRNQVRARSGLAQYFVPDSKGSLDTLLAGTVASIPDPQRHVATEIAFEAEPDWADNAAAAVHASAIAGFDVYELDLDELAPSEDPRDLAMAAEPWAAAKRIAHVSEVGHDTAALVPDSNANWKAWRSHFPSGTARLADRQSKGAMLPWYSSRESAAMPPQRFPRIRLLPLAPEQAIADLLQGGAPTRVVAGFSLAPDSPIRETLRPLDDAPLSDAALLQRLPAITKENFRIFSLKSPGTGTSLAEFGASKIDSAAITPAVLGGVASFEPSAAGTAFTAALLRDLLLRLSWDPVAADILAAWRRNPLALEGLTLVLIGTRDGARTGTSEVALDLSSPIHPMLEEALAELALLREGEQTYRGLTVMPQPALMSPAKEMTGLMAFTPVETDPFGWGALQTLGLARTVRIHDPASDEFLCGGPLVRRVNAVFGQCHARWAKRYGTGDFGQPFVDICLKPNRDMWLSTFDKPQRYEEEATGRPFSLDDDSLAFVQIALRPRAVAEWVYGRHTVEVPDGPAGPVTIEISSDEPSDVERLSDRQSGSMDTGLQPCVFTVDGGEQSFLFRGRAALVGVEGTGPAHPRIVVKRNGEVVQTETPDVWSGIGGPDDPDSRMLYERLDDRTPADWKAAWERDGAPARRALDAWRASIRASAPDIAMPKSEELAVFAASFVPWTRRFLDFGCASSAGPERDLAYSLSAPIDDKPLRLAADADGLIRFQIVRPDRWGSVRAYAVKPIGRYHGLLAGIGLTCEQNARGLVYSSKPGGWAFTDGSFLPAAPIGYGVAVSHRTEKIEKPLVLGSNMVEDAGGHWAQVVVARHGEEALASANRTMLARLGVPASLTSFGRVYRHPEWPARFAKILPAHPAQGPDIYPERTAAAPLQPAATLMNGATLGVEVQALPAIANGADIWRIAPQPPHYQLVMALAERAGSVVSDPVVTIHDTMPRRSLAGRGDELFGNAHQPYAELARVDGEVVLRVTHPLIAYRDVTPERTLDWITGGLDDIAHWPDADIIYGISRRRADTGLTEYSEEAEIRLVASLADTAADTEEDTEDDTTKPIVVRTRGTRFASGVAAEIERTTDAPAARSDFRLTSRLDFKPDPTLTPDGESMLLASEIFRWDKVEAFNAMATRFGAIEAPHDVKADFELGQAADGAAYLAQLRQRSAAARRIRGHLWAIRLDQWISTANPLRPPEELKHGVSDSVGDTFETWLAVGAPAGDGLSAARKDGSVHFRGFGAMSDAEAGHSAWDDDLFKDDDKRRIRGWLARQVVGAYDGFWLRAVDGRSDLPLTTASLVERRIRLPEWLEEALAG